VFRLKQTIVNKNKIDMLKIDTLMVTLTLVHCY